MHPLFFQFERHFPARGKCVTRNNMSAKRSLELFISWHHDSWLVSTYVVCERLSVMHEPAGLVEILVQILQNTPILNLVPPSPLPPPKKNWNLGRSWHFKTFQFWLQNNPQNRKNFNCDESNTMKVIEIDTGNRFERNNVYRARLKVLFADIRSTVSIHKRDNRVFP